MQEINVEQIMQEIREEIKRKGYTEDMLSFTPVLEQENIAQEPVTTSQKFEEFRRLVCIANDTWNYPLVDWILKGRMGGIKKIVFLAVRAISRPFMRPPRRMDATIVKALNQLVGYLTLQEDVIKKQEDRIRELEKKIGD